MTGGRFTPPAWRLTPAAQLITEQLGGLVIAVVLVWWLANVILPAVGPDPFLAIVARQSDPFGELSVPQVVVVTFARSAVLIGVALAIAMGVGVLAAVLSARSRSGLLRGAAWAVGTAGVSVPSFFWALLLRLLVIVVYLRTGLRLFPTFGYGIDEHVVLPALALAARPAAYVFRLTATALLDAERAEYTTTARGKGLSELTILIRHQFPNARAPMLAAFLLAAHGVASSLAIVEYVFGWQGAGFAFIHAVASGRFALAAVLFAVFATGLGLLALAVAVGTRPTPASASANPG